MHAASIHARFRGVVCQSCGKPIQLSASFINREISIKATTTLADLASKVFSVRCRACRVEGIYSLGQITEFPEPDTSWLLGGRTRRRSVPSRRRMRKASRSHSASSST
jgi:hypothetical protein